jgi:Zn ribbon nucleic-acid-binding protein
VHKRERFVTSVTCPECALTGSATWEENQSGNLETTIKCLSYGFRIGPDNEIICAECGVKARISGIASGTKPGHSSAK